jgi:hypothetical protein
MSTLAGINIFESEKFFRALSRLWRQVKLNNLTVLFNLSDRETIGECHILGLSPLRRYKATP